MKGIIFKLLEQVVTDTYGADTWDDLLGATGLDGIYTSLGNYPDEQLAALLQAASDATGKSQDELLRWFGHSAIPLLASAHPEFFAGHSSTGSFLLTLNDIIHAEVRKIYPGADVPEFEFATSPDGAFELGYRSARKLCALAEGFVEGAAAHYGEAVHIDQPTCMSRGDDHCTIVCRFAPA